MLFHEKEPSIVFKDIDLEELQNSKKAFQSSISKWSKFDDPLRAINSALKIEDYAFHTGIEENPWWMIDLEQEEYIEYIEIQNSKKNPDNIKKVQVFYSLDGKEWFFIDSSMYEFIYAMGGGIDKLLVLLNSYIKVRFVKIVLNAKDCLHLNKIKIFKRKFPGLVVATRADGFGGRMFAILNSMYLAYVTGFKFGYVWNARVRSKSIDSNQIDAWVDTEDKIFDKNWINEYSYTSTVKHRYANKLYFSSLNDLKKDFYEYSWGYVCAVNHALFKYNIDGITRSDMEKKIPIIWNKICFSERYLDIIKKVEKCRKNIGDFIAIHMRAGNSIYDDVFKRLIFMPPQILRIFPFELAIEIIQKANSCNVVLFSADIESAKTIKEYCNNSSLCAAKVYTVDDFGIFDDEMEQTFFDFVLMTKSKKIINPSLSTYSELAALVGNIPIFAINEIFSFEEMHEILSNNLELNLHPLQKSASKAYHFFVANKLNIDIKIKKEILDKALFYDDNSVYRIMYLDLLFSNLNIYEAERYLENNLTKVKIHQDFFQVLFSRFPGDINFEYERYFALFICNSSEKFPYISYVAAKIFEFQKQYEKAFQYCQYALDKNPNNHLFVSFANSLEKIVNKNSKIDVSVSKKIGAVDIVKNKLSYKLGQAMIENSKSIKGYIIMPFVLSDIVKHYKKTKQPYIENKLNSYSDYNDAIKYKNHMSYQLGSALIQAHKNRYKGGYFKFIYDILKIKNTFKGKK
ncbi:hypothetical protein A0Y42_02540 [Campylobacter lari]|uniref:F5/8 type C domain-containing protein n=1 Tax=Campylobacter lari TaxID=201 RepID=A0A5L8LME9_CAMLA|nr:hypothetical protein [Campylobacter lari]